MVSERPARSRKSAHGALEPEIDDFAMNLIRISMVSERSARSRKSPPGALNAIILGVKHVKSWFLGKHRLQSTSHIVDFIQDLSFKNLLNI